MKIQEYLTCAIQNIQALVQHGYNPKRSLVMAMEKTKETVTRTIKPVLNSTKAHIERIRQESNELLTGFIEIALCC